MAKKRYSVATSLREALPRSTRRQAVSANAGGSALLSGSGPDSGVPDGHDHTNKALLDSLSADSSNYLYRRNRSVGASESAVEKIKAGYSDDSKLWDGKKYEDYFDQKLRKVDVVEFLKAILGALQVKGDSEFSGALSSKDYDDEIVGDKPGWKINAEGDMTIRSLAVRLQAMLGSLKVEGDSTFKGDATSSGFKSGMSDGSGWGIVKDGARYKAELDELMSRFKALLGYLEVEGDSTFKGNVASSGFRSGMSNGKGWAIGKEDDKYKGELDELIVRLEALLGSLQVNGDSVFKGQMSSEEFMSGLLGGKGWAITKRKVLNALGVEETKYTGEFDDLVIRGALRVFALVASQLLGENDNRVFTGMMEVDHYDASSGKIWLRTQDGKLYNPFRPDDYIMVQQFNGMPSEANDHYITKHYEMIITDAGCGDVEDGEDRLDWVTFSNFVSADGRQAGQVIAKGDTLTRVDNATDADRKGLIQIITVGTAAPYMDIVYGLKTDPDNSLKGRLGNLQGINHPLFGWLHGFGEMLQNLYAVGDFRLRRTGESLDAKIEMLRGLFSTAYSKITYDLTDKDNYLKNASFTESMEGWLKEDNTTVITNNGSPMIVNGNTLNPMASYAAIEEYDGRNMLHVYKSWVKQLNADIRKPGKHKEYIGSSGSETSDQYVEVDDKLYLTVKFLPVTSGTLTMGFLGAGSDEGSLPFIQEEIPASKEWQILEYLGTWDGLGDFMLQYTGNMYISYLLLGDRALDEFKKEVSTQIIQTATNISLIGTKIDSLNATDLQLGLEIDAANEKIRLYADKVDDLEGITTQLGLRIDAANESISIYADKVDRLEETTIQLGLEIDAANENIRLYADKVDNLEETAVQLGLEIDAANENISLYAEKVDALEGTTSQLSIRINALDNTINLHASSISENKTAISRLTVSLEGISSSVTSLEGDLETANSRIDAVEDAAEAAGYAETYTQSSNPWQSWPSGTEYRHVGATWKYTGSNSSVSLSLVGHSGTQYAVNGHFYRYAGVDNSNLWEDITGIGDSASYISQKKDMITAVVGSFDSAGNLTNTSGLVTTAYATQIYATKTMYNNQNSAIEALDSRITVAETGISVLASKFDSDGELINKSGLVSTSEFASLFSEAVSSDPTINSKAEVRTSVQWDPDSGLVTSEIKLSADMLTLEGYTTINGGFAVDEDGNVHGKDAYFENTNIGNSSGNSHTKISNKTLSTMIAEITEGKGITGTVEIPTSGGKIGLDLQGNKYFFFIIKDQTLYCNVPSASVYVASLNSTYNRAKLVLDINIYIQAKTASGANAFTHTVCKRTKEIATFTTTGTTPVSANAYVESLDLRSSKMYLPNGYTAELCAQYSVRFSEGSGSVSVTPYLASALDVEWWLAGAAWTLVGIDGVHISNMDKYFRVINNGETLQVFLQGLPTSLPSTPGALWNDNGTIKIST